MSSLLSLICLRGRVQTIVCRFTNMRLMKHRFSTASLPVSIRAVPFPALSPTMTAGSIAAWRKNAGETLAVGDILCDIDTDKASVGFEMQDDGVLAKVLVPAHGPELPVGTPIALIVDSLDDYKVFQTLSEASYTHLTIQESSAPPAPTPSTQSPSTNDASTVNHHANHHHFSHGASHSKKSHKLSPAARHIVKSKSLDVSSLSSTGGRTKQILTKSDVLTGLLAGVVKASVPSPAVSQSSMVQSVPKTVTAPSSPLSVSVPSEPVNARYVDIPNSNMRKVIAKRLTESKATVPHLYISMEVNIDEVLSLRKQLKKNLEVNVSVNDLVIKSAALALRDVPQIHSRWNKQTSSVTPGGNIDISVAVATPTGLITPIVTNADKRGLANINSTVKDLATRARDGKLKPEEYQGGAFSISNLGKKACTVPQSTVDWLLLGMYGITSFSAVINPPQACILAVGSGVSRICVKKSKPEVETVVTVQLSADRRVVDEAVASQFLQVFRDYLNDPKRLML